MDRKPKAYWPKYLKHVLLVSRVRINQETGYSPFELTYGFKPTVKTTKQGPKLQILQGKPPLEEQNLNLKTIRLKAKAKGIKRVAIQTLTSQQKPILLGTRVWVLAGN